MRLATRLSEEKARSTVPIFYAALAERGRAQLVVRVVEVDGAWTIEIPGLR